jgi:RNA polymerase sigma-70 factor (sigma-E family)
MVDERCPEAVMGRSRRGAARAEFEAFVRRATVDLFRTAFALTCDPVQAEDLVQEALVLVAKHWDRARTMEWPVAYARKVLVNLVLKSAPGRARQHDELAFSEDLWGLPDEYAAQALRAVEDLDEFAAALTKLPPRQRAALVLRYWEDMPETEVAAILGCPTGTVGSLASRGAKRLAVALGASQAPSPEPAPERRPTAERNVKC